MPSEFKRKTDCAFSLIELLVSTAIIAILASLLFVALQHAKKRADATVCLNNLRQQGIWLAEFTSQYGEYPLSFNVKQQDLYPNHAPTWTGSLRRIGGFPDAILEHDAGDVFHCPSAKLPPDLGPNEGYGSYGYNATGTMGSTEKSFIGLGGTEAENSLLRPPPVKIGEVVNPSNMIAIGDSFTGWKNFIIDGRYDGLGIRYGLAPRNGETARALKRHDGRGKFLFCDGHVEGIALEKLYFNPAEQFGRMWNRDNKFHPERLQ